MNASHMNTISAHEDRWLSHYYSIRTAFSAVWVALGFSVGPPSPEATGTLLFVYPAWDSLANYFDMSRSGGRPESRTQTITVVGVMTAVAVIMALKNSMNWMLGVFGIWAMLSGLARLGTTVRRWKSLPGQ